MVWKVWGEWDRNSQLSDWQLQITISIKNFHKFSSCTCRKTIWNLFKHYVNACSAWSNFYRRCYYACCGTETAPCRCKIRYVSKCTAASRGPPCDSTTLVVKNALEYNFAQLSSTRFFWVWAWKFPSSSSSTSLSWRCDSTLVNPLSCRQSLALHVDKVRDIYPTSGNRRKCCLSAPSLALYSVFFRI